MFFDLFIISSKFSFEVSPDYKVIISNDVSNSFDNLVQDPGLFILDLEKVNDFYLVRYINKISGEIKAFYTKYIYINLENIKSLIDFTHSTKRFADINFLLLKNGFIPLDTRLIFDEENIGSNYDLEELKENNIYLKTRDIPEIIETNFNPDNIATNVVRLIPEREKIIELISFCESLKTKLLSKSYKREELDSILNSLEENILRHKSESFSENSNVYALIDQAILEGMIYKLKYLNSNFTH